jgi:hypothetical protein
MQTKNITVDLATTSDFCIFTKGTDLDIDPSHALVNTAFFAPSFLPATLKPTYTSALDRIFCLLGLPAAGGLNAADGLEVVIDYSFGTLGAVQPMLANDT